MRCFCGICSLVAIATCTLLAQPAAAANLLSDPGFEDLAKFTMDGPPFVDSWEAFTSGASAPSLETTTMPHLGAQSLELAIANEANQFAGAFQDVVVGAGAAGLDTTYSGWHKVIGDSGGIEIRIEWRDSVNDVEISRTPNFAPTPGSAYEPFSLTAAVPAGADTARIVYAIQSFGGALNQQVFVDDLSYTIIPEPGTVGLAILCGISLLGVRRR